MNRSPTTVNRAFLCLKLSNYVNLNSSVGIGTGYGLEDGGVRVRVPVMQEFSILHVVEADSWVHPTSYTMGTGGFFPRG
jgi:hypothetical protein